MLCVCISRWYVQFLSYVLVVLHRLELKSPRSNCHILFVPWQVLSKNYYTENTQSHFMTIYKFPLLYINGKQQKSHQSFHSTLNFFFSFLSIEVNKQTNKKTSGIFKLFFTSSPPLQIKSKWMKPKNKSVLATAELLCVNKSINLETNSSS